MKRIISQFHGLGDILFLVPLIRKWQAQGDEIIWPIIPEYLSIQKNFPDINFVDKTKYAIPYDNRNRFTWNGYTVEPLRWADLYKPPASNCMRAKYDMMGEDFNMWHELKWERDHDAETRLYDMVCPSGEYNLVSRRFGSHTQGQYTVQIPVDGVELRDIPGFNLLDWALVIESAKQIHTVGSSINYMLEVLDYGAEEVHLYVRKPIERNFDYYRYLLKKTYNFHY